VGVPARLREALDVGVPIALVSEKARSEFIVAPVLLTVRLLSKGSLTIYSGQRLDVSSDEGLAGECDFILATAPPLPILQAPLVTIVEAKKNDIEAGLGQCAAQMLGAQRFNQQEGHTDRVVFGCVTTGEVWQFLVLEAKTVSLDTRRYYLNNVDLILGVFQMILNRSGLRPPSPPA
jgi:hypothetical protein